MKYIDKVYSISLFLLFALCLLVFIKPEYFSINFLIITFTTLMVIFFVTSYKYGKKYPQKKNYNYFGYAFFTISCVYLIYTLVIYINR